jgi:hypothetical protein
MTGNTENLVLEQLRLIREDLGGLKRDLTAFKDDMSAFKDETHSDFVAQKTMLFGLASVIGQIDERVEHVEEKLGVKQ